jgi:protein-S-isoprenylcysteine O-methyltransferase Ste14
MVFSVGIVLLVIWSAFFAYWWIPVLWKRTPAKRISFPGSFLSFLFLPIIAFRIVGGIFAPWLYGFRVFPVIAPVIIAGVGVTIAGLGFAVWARRHLGTNWSARPAIKTNHTITRTGPYAVVRHPIYTGTLVAILGTAIATGTWVAFGIFIVVLCALLVKIHIEESFLLEEFGGEYAAYRREVATLIPFVV